MKKIITLLLVSMLTLSLKKEETVSVVNIKEVKSQKIVIPYFPSDDNRWSSRIITKFNAVISSLKLNEKTVGIAYKFTMKDEEFINDIIQQKPDFVFLADDYLYQKFAKKIVEKTGAYIIFSTYYTSKKDLNQVADSSQSGVYAEANMDYLLKKLRKLTKKDFDSLHIVGSGFAEGMIEHITSKVSKEVKVSSSTTFSWDVFVKEVKNASKKGSLVMPLAPFGVLDSEKNKVTNFQYNNLMLSLKTPTIGYGSISKLGRTISMAISPEELGENAATILYSKLTSGKDEIQDYKSFDLSIDHKNILKLGIQIDDKELLGFIKL